MLWVVILFASVVRAFTGFGFALCAVPGFSFLLSPTDSAVLAVMLTLGISVLTIQNYRGNRTFNSIVPMLVMALVGTIIGAWVLVKIDQNQFRALVGSIVIVSSLLLSLYQPQKRVDSKPLAISVGLGAGLMNGALGIPGPPVIIYALFAEPEVNRSRAMLMQFFAAASFFGSLVFFLTGLIHWQVVGIFFAGLPVMILGNYIGDAFFMRYGDRFYRKIALAISIILGVVTLISALVESSQ